MTYIKRFYGEMDSFPVTYQEALRTLLGTYEDNDTIRSMLTIQNRIKCLDSEIKVYDGDSRTAPTGWFNLADWYGDGFYEPMEIPQKVQDNFKDEDW